MKLRKMVFFTFLLLNIPFVHSGQLYAASLTVSGGAEAGNEAESIQDSMMEEHNGERRRKVSEFLREASEEASKDSCHIIDYHKNKEAWNACKGNCSQINTDHKDARNACFGYCAQIDTNKNKDAWDACHGHCYFSNDSLRDACVSCGGGPRWTAMYLLGVTMVCYK
jgi:hypothetical protein